MLTPQVLKACLCAGIANMHLSTCIVAHSRTAVTSDGLLFYNTYGTLSVWHEILQTLSD